MYKGYAYALCDIFLAQKCPNSWIINFKPFPLISFDGWLTTKIFAFMERKILPCQDWSKRCSKFLWNRKQREEAPCCQKAEQTYISKLPRQLQPCVLRYTLPTWWRITNASQSAKILGKEDYYWYFGLRQQEWEENSDKEYRGYQKIFLTALS